MKQQQTSSYLQQGLVWIKSPRHLLLISIILVAAFFRFYNMPDRMGFDKDPTRDILIAIYGSDTLHFPLIGPHSGIAPFTFGPWYYYALILTRVIMRTDFAPFYLIPTYSLIFVVLMYFIGKKLKDEWLGLILAFLAAFSPAQIGPVSGLSNPNLVSVHAAASLLFFVVYIKNKKSNFFLLAWGLVLGIGINHHYQMIPLLLLPLTAFSIKWRESLKHGVLFLVGMMLSFLPLLIFNVLHDWHTPLGLLRYASQGGQYIPNSWTIYLRDFWPQFLSYMFGIPFSFSLIVVTVFLTGYFYLLVRRKLAYLDYVLLGIFLVLFLGLRYYNGPREYYYYFFLHPLIFLIPGLFLWYFSKRRLGKIALGVVGVAFFLSALPYNLISFSTRSDQMLVRKDAYFLVQKFPNTRLTIYNCRDASIHKAQGTAFYLYTYHVLGEMEKKIGSYEKSPECEIPPGAKGEVGEGLYDLSTLSDQMLSAYGWRKITPETAFTQTVAWWKD